MAKSSSGSTSLNLLDAFNDSAMRSSDTLNTDFSFANFDISDYVSNGDQLDVFAEQSAGTSSSSSGTVNGQTVAMMTEALASQLQDMHSTGGSLSSQPHQHISQQHPGLSTPLSMLHSDGSSASHAMNTAPSSGHATPIGAYTHSPSVPGDPATELLKKQLSKQLQLQHLQHMQNQLLQQQVRSRCFRD